MDAKSDMYMIGEFVPLDKVKKDTQKAFFIVVYKTNDINHLLEYDGNTLNISALDLELIYVHVSFLEPRYGRCRLGICETPQQKVKEYPIPNYRKSYVIFIFKMQNMEPSSHHPYHVNIINTIHRPGELPCQQILAKSVR